MSERGRTPEEDRALGYITEGVIKQVTPYSKGGGWSVTMEDGTGCGVRDMGIEPQVGDAFTIFGRWGSTFHGQELNGKLLWYLSVEEQEAQDQEWLRSLDEKKKAGFERDKAKLDADYDSLPQKFQERIDKFRRTNLDFRWDFEAYEMSCCVDALRIAEWCIDHGEGDTVADRILAYQKLPWDEQKLAGVFSGHSGNSFGMACRLAYWWVTDPGQVIQEHGALVPLVGCEKYGCPHDEKG